MTDGRRRWCCDDRLKATQEKAMTRILGNTLGLERIAAVVAHPRPAAPRPFGVGRRPRRLTWSATGRVVVSGGRSGIRSLGGFLFQWFGSRLKTLGVREGDARQMREVCCVVAFKNFGLADGTEEDDNGCRASRFDFHQRDLKW
ncbi:hypothetical protein ACLB2K_007156 [Fragaria x ananassa]